MPVRWTVATLGWEGTAGQITATLVASRVLGAASGAALCPVFNVAWTGAPPWVYVPVVRVPRGIPRTVAAFACRCIAAWIVVCHVG